MQKYKVFLNEKSILFTSSGKITITKPTNNPPDFANVLQVSRWLDEFEKGDGTEKVIQSDNPEIFFKGFREALTNIEAAGGVIRNEKGLLFIFRNEKWDLPKGKIDKGESPVEAALREVEEECGIHGHRIIRLLEPTYHLYRSPYKKSKGEWIFKKTHWFEMEYNGNESGFPQTDEGITEIRWFARDELGEVLDNTYGNLVELIKAYCL